MTVNPPTYFYIMRNVVKVNHKCDNKSYCRSTNLSHSLSQSVPCTPQISARSGSQLYLLTFKKLLSIAALEAVETHIFPWSLSSLSSRNGEAVSSNLQLTSPKLTRDSHHICMLRAACLMQHTISSYLLVSHWVWQRHEVNVFVCEKLIQLKHKKYSWSTRTNERLDDDRTIWNNKKDASKKS